MQWLQVTRTSDDLNHIRFTQADHMGRNCSGKLGSAKTIHGNPVLKRPVDPVRDLWQKKCLWAVRFWCEWGRKQPEKLSRQEWKHWHDLQGGPQIPMTTTNISGWQMRRGRKRLIWPTPALSPLFPPSYSPPILDHPSQALGRVEFRESSAIF